MAFSLTRPTRLATAALLALGLAACGSDSNGPSRPAPFDAAGTSADIQAMAGSFDSDVLNSFIGVGAGIDSVASGAASFAVAAVKAGPEAARTGSLSNASAYAHAVAKLLPRTAAPGLSLSGGAIPDSAVGKTYVYDSDVQHYVASDRAGAPANGVRFILYAVGLDGQPALPLNEIGYADLTDESTATSRAGHLVVVSGATTYLDYKVTGTGSATGGSVNIEGFVSNGTVRADFNLANAIKLTETSLDITVDYSVSLPDRDASLTFTEVISENDSGSQVTLNLTMKGPHGEVSIKGDITSTGETISGNFTVRVNGEVYATITPGSDGTTLDGSGRTLTDDEQTALANVFNSVSGVLGVFAALLSPVGNWIGADSA
jgi:hypothetical protein